MSEIIKKPESKEALLAKIQSLRQDLQKPAQGPSFSPKIGSGNLLQSAFLFDTTGSMFDYFEKGKKSIAKIAKSVATKNPNTKFCYIAYKNHGDEEDYFDGKNPFLATSFSSLPAQLEGDLQKVENGGGGDSLTAIEDVLHYLNTQAGWMPNAIKVVVLIGDMPPHGVVDSVAHCPHEYNYKVEVQQLKSKGIKIYSVFCYQEDELKSARKQKIQNFFKWIASETEGRYLDLSEIDELVDLLTAICMKETGHLEEFIAELKNLGQLKAGTSKEKTLLALGSGK